MIYIIIILVLFYLFKTLFELEDYNLLHLIYLLIISFCVMNIINQIEFFDIITFNGKKYINSITNINENKLNDINDNYLINLDDIKNKLNIDKNKIIFNLSNRPIIKKIKNYEQIKNVIKPIFDEIKLINSNLYLRNVIEIEQNKIDNQAKLSFIMIIDNDNEINKKIYVEILYEKIFEDQDVFNYNIKSNFKNYINKLLFV